MWVIINFIKLDVQVFGGAIILIALQRPDAIILIALQRPDAMQ
jgi:hypothetical protein